MIKYIITIYIVSLIVIGQVYSQTVELQPDSKSTLSIQTINKTDYQLLMNAKTNVQIKHFSVLASNTSKYGSVVVLNNQLLKGNGEDFHKVNVPYTEIGNNGLSVSSDGQFAIVIRRENENNIFSFFDVENEVISSEYVVPFDNSSYFIMNQDASRFFYIGRTYHDISTPTEYGIYMVERNGTEFETQLITEANSTFDLRFVSHSGDRLIFKQNIDERPKWFYIDHENGEWSQPKELVVYNEDGEIANPLILDYTADGKTLIGGDSKGFAIIQEEKESYWLKTSILEYDINYRDRPQISDDGNIVAVQAFREEIGFSNYKYDIFVFFKNPSGEWTKQQVNSADEHTRTDILLSGDGTKLFWIPYQEDSSIPNSLNLDN